MKHRSLSFAVALLIIGVSILVLSPRTVGAASVSKGPRASSTPTVSPTPIHVYPRVTPVANPWKEGDFQNGIQLYWHAMSSSEYVAEQARTILNYVVSLGANSVAISFPIYTDGAIPTTVYAGDETPSVEQLGLVVAAAKQRKLRVTLRPIIDETNIVKSDPEAWRGSITPRNVSAWFAQYGATITPYLQLAQQQQVQEFVVGTELFSLEQYTSEWTSLRQTAQSLYGGELSYSANWRGFGQHAIPFQQLGLDFYLKTDLPDTATVQQLTQVMTQWLMAQPASIRANLTLQEVGIAAEAGAFQHSWYWGDAVANANYFAQQAAWFTAAYQAAKAAGTEGVYYWMIDSNQSFSPSAIASQPAGGFIGRPAAVAIEKSFLS